jgi:hypothetical protein
MVPAMQWLASVQGTAFARWVATSTSIWAYPSILTAHTIGLGILVGASLALDLRLLGLLPGTPLAPLKKMLLIAIGVMTIGLIRKSAFGDLMATESGAVSARARLLAGISVLCWAGAIVAGRLMAYVK